jgi:hypothetical protein
MLAVVVAQVRPILPAGNAALWVVIALLLALLFIPPRLLYASRFFPVSGRATVIAMVSLLVLLAAGAWLAVG